MPSSSSSSSLHLSHKLSRRPRGVDSSTTMIKLRQEQKKASSNGYRSDSKVEEVRYGECRKNHAARIGGYAVDGCREFMASGEEGTSAALRCAACDCHRSFHKRMVVVESEEVCDCSSISSSQR